MAQYRSHAVAKCHTPTGSRPTTPQLCVNNSKNKLECEQNSSSSPSKDLLGCDSHFQTSNNFTLHHRYHALSGSSNQISFRNSGEFRHQLHTSHGSPGKNLNNSKLQVSSLVLNERMNAPSTASSSFQTSNSVSLSSKDTKELTTPSSTPTTSRKSRRRSNLFIPSKKSDTKLSEPGSDPQIIGSGRVIPLKQGYLYKRSINSLNKEWKKKYVTLTDDGRLTYHSSLHDYMDDIHGKEIALNCVTVKLPGQKPRGSKSIITNSILTSSVNFYWKATNNAISDGIAGLTLPKDRKSFSNFDSLRDSTSKQSTSHTSGDEGVVLSHSNSQTFLTNENTNISKHNEIQSSTVKKRHRRVKSSGVKNELDGIL